MGQEIGFLGGGRITAIFLAAWKDAGLAFDGVVVSDPDPAVREGLAKRFPEIRTVEDNRLAAAQRTVFLSLHPPMAKTVLPEIAATLRSDGILVSLAPVLTFAKLSALTGGFGRCARMIPNAPSLIHRGFNPVAYAPALPPEAKAVLKPLFDPLGEQPEVPEANLEAYAILAAMGPTYFWFQWQTLRELGSSFGLTAEASDRALRTMLHGAVDLMFASGLDPAAVMDTVPVKPLAEGQEGIERLFREKLSALHSRLTS